MAFSAPLGRIILFGGRVASTAFDDTWGWDGTTWTRIDSPSSP
ncbi:MAG: kelch repeat-containing protein, partial [Kofleriaceae bacterium]